MPHRSALDSDQRLFINQTIDTSILVNGGPSTGKTVLALWRANTLVAERKRCLFIAPTSLFLKYANYYKKEFTQLRCASFYEAIKNGSHYDVIFLDDSHRYSLGQIQSLASLTRYLYLCGDYSREIVYGEGKASLDDVINLLGCTLMNLYRVYGVPDAFLQLLPKYRDVHSPYLVKIPIIARIGSLEEQCRAIISIVESRHLDDVAILCYTRACVRSAMEVFKHCEWQIEGFLPGIIDGIDTLKPGSGEPKIMTIASAMGLHFKTVFVISFDNSVVWNNPEAAVETAITRAKENLYVFYKDQLPEPLSSCPPNLYKSTIEDAQSISF